MIDLSKSPLLQERAAYLRHVTDATPDELDYQAKLNAQFSLDWKNHVLESPYFWDKSIDDYMERNDSDSYLRPWPTRKDTWRSTTRRQTISEKIDAVLAAVADLNLRPELYSYEVFGEEVKDAADALEVLLDYAEGQNLSELKDKWAVRYLLVHGTVAESVQWMRLMKKLRTGKLDPKTGTLTKGQERDVVDMKKIWSQVHPLNRVVLTDRTQPIMDLQPHIWRLTVVPYEIAEAIFGKWKRFKNVVPISGQPNDEWTSLTFQQQIEETGDARLCRIVEYENRFADEYAILINGVLLTEPLTPMQGSSNEKHYGNTWTQLFPTSPHWAYGQSFVQRMRNDAVLLDFFYNALVDKARQGLEPPILTSYRSILNRNMWKPGTATQGDINFKPLIQHQGVTSADLQMAQFVEENLNKASTPPIIGGQGAPGDQTAYEVREQMRAALRSMWNVFSAVAEMKRQRAESMLRLVLEHYPHMNQGTIKNKLSDAVGGIHQVFTTCGAVSKDRQEGRKMVSFVDMENVNLKKALPEMMKEQKNSALQGEPIQRLFISADSLREMRHVVQVVVNPSDRKSKKADKAEIIDEYRMYAGNPAFDQQWAAKLLLTGLGRDPEEGVAKQPQTPPGPPQGQSDPNQEQQVNAAQQPQQAMAQQGGATM